MAAVRFVGNRLDKATLNALVAGTLVNGSKPSVWWARQSAEFRNTFMDTVRTSMRNGESLQQAITRVVGGTIDGVTAPGIIKQTKRKAGALVSTSMSAVTNEAALKSFQANNDVIKAVTQLSTLDNRTSDVCIAYSGQTWNLMTLEPIMGSSLPYNGGPPRHFNCRSRLRPVTKTFKELGVDAPEIPPGTRASMDGQVPADITFNQFLKKKPISFQDKLLGPKRAQLWRNGDINLTQLVDMRGNPLTITQLEQRIGLKPKPQFNPATNKTVNKEKLTPPKEIFDEPKKVLSKSEVVKLADGDKGTAAIAQADEAAEKARATFNNAIANRIAKGDIDDVESFFALLEGSPYIDETIINAARQRIATAVNQADIKARQIVASNKVDEITNLQHFKEVSAKLVVENMDDPLLGKQLGKVLGEVRKAKEEVFGLHTVEAALKAGKFGTAEEALEDMAQTPVVKAKLKELKAGEKAITDTLTKIKNYEPEDFDDFVKYAKGVLNDGDPPQWVRSYILDSNVWEAAEKHALSIKFIRQAEKALDDLDLAKAKELIDGLPSSVEVKYELEAKLQMLKLEADKIAKQKMIKFQDKATVDLMNKGFTDDIIDSMADEIKAIAKLKDGAWDDLAQTQVRLKALEMRDLRDDAIDRIKALNKQSKGLDEMNQFHSTLPQNIRYNDLYNEVYEKQRKLAKAKAEKGKQEFFAVLEDEIGSDDFAEYFELINEVSKEITKKLGKAQTEKMMSSIKQTIEFGKSKGGSVNMSAYNSAAKIDFAVEIEPMLGSFSRPALQEAIDLFKKNGNDPTARSKLFEILGGKTEEQKWKIKEYVHQQVNPKLLPNGKVWDDAVAEIVTKHANNATHKEIRALLTKYTDDMDLGMATNFEQTILTRARVTKFDDLGVTPEGAPTPAVERIREQLKRDGDPNDVPLPTYTDAELQHAAKGWISYSDVADETFLRHAKEAGDSYIKAGAAKIAEGERMYGKGAWGISPEDWDKWVKNVAPTLKPWHAKLVNEYTGGMARRINSGLYNGGTEFHNVGGARALNEALDKFPKMRGQVYRGTHSDGNWNADYVDARYEVGKTITERNFGSSATQEAAQFSGDIQFIITAKGKNGAIMGHVGQYGTGEMEVLWKAGTRFKVLRKKRVGNGIKIWMEEI